MAHDAIFQGHALFQLDKLIPDERFNDSSLVVAPCNSPEQAPITLGTDDYILPLCASNCSFAACSHAQQVIWQLFNAVEKGFDASGDKDTAFLAGA